MLGCATSGVLGTSGVVTASKCKLVSVHVTSNSANTNVIKIFDNASAASGTEIVRLNTNAANNVTAFNMEYDMHGVMAANGLFLSITGSGSCSVTVNYA